jgi:hypothetical protein
MPEPILSNADLLPRFKALDAFLLEHQALWRPKPFTQLRLPWETELSELAHWLRQRDLAQADAAQGDPTRLAAPAPFAQLAEQATRLSTVGELDEQADSQRPRLFEVDVPGRKLAQIKAFAARLHFRQRPQHWLDWCSGKGHLGRWLTHGDQQLTCLEHDPALVAAGAALSQRLGLNAAHRQQDVLSLASPALLPQHSPVALHACGELHVRLLQLASQQGCRQLAVAPCCYNRIPQADYPPLSAPARQSALHLSRDDLALALCETVTAGARTRRQRDQSMAWRLGFDLLQRQLRGSDQYLPTPSLAPAWLQKSFAEFCCHLAALKQLPVPGPQPWAQLEQQGWQRLAEVRNLELLRALFRRPLEVWLLLDRALYLQEQGYRVRLGQFCQARLTPRNLLLLAERD